MADLLTGQDEPQAPRVGLREVVASLRQRKVALAAIFGVATGMPPVMVTATLGFWLREEGVALTAIGFMAWVGAFVSVKFLWAPFLDRVRVPVLGRLLGHRRSWMLVGQVFVTLGIFGMVLVGPEGGLAPFAAFAMLTAFASATQDISVDAWRIESATDREQDLIAAAYIFGLRGGYFLGNAPILAGSALIGWAGAYALAACGGIVGLGAILFAREPNAARDFSPIRSAAEAFAAFVAPVRVFSHDHGRALWLILGLTAIFFVPDGLINSMVGPFYIDLGYSGPEIAAMRTVFGLSATLTGVIAAGLLGMRFGTLPVMALAVFLCGISNLGFSALALSGGDRTIWTGVILFEGFSAGLANAAIVAWAGRLTNPKATAAQFALLSSLMTLLPGFFGGFAGLAIEGLQARLGDNMLGFATYFAITPFASLAPLIMIALVARQQRAA